MNLFFSSIDWLVLNIHIILTNRSFKASNGKSDIRGSIVFLMESKFQLVSSEIIFLENLESYISDSIFSFIKEVNFSF